MNQQFTIRDFIDNRWADAKSQLSGLDPEFVRNVETLDRAQKSGLLVPRRRELPLPNRRLSDEWHELLSTTMEIVEELDRLLLTVSLMDPKKSTGIDRRLAVYYFDVWVQRVFNLCDKVEKLVARTCRLLLRGRKSANWKEIETRYRSHIKGRVKNEIEELRSPAVHGAGGKGTLSRRVITEEHQGWEISVVFGPSIIEEIRDAHYTNETLMSPEQWFENSGAKTNYVVETLGAILLDLDREISGARTT